MNEAKPYACPTCEAEYKVVRVEAKATTPPPRVRTASGFGRGRAGSGKGVGFAALRQGTEMVLQHGERHHGATRYQRRGCGRRRIPSLQLGARRRTLQGCWQTVPLRASGRSQ